MKSIIFLAILHVGGSMETNIPYQDKAEIDPKEAFFRYFRFYDTQQKSKPFESDEFQNIPSPGGFQLQDEERLKRSYHVLVSPGLTSYFQINVSNEKFKPKRIKRQKSISNSFEEDDERKSKEDETIKPPKDTPIQDLIINDFIRFKRQTGEGDSLTDIQRQKREPEVRTKKMMMERELGEPRPDREREARGTTKEQWIKQPYPVERPVEDSVASASVSASDSVRAPRVHFVTTQRRGVHDRERERDPPSYNRGRMHDEREARSRDPLPLPPPQPQPHYHAYPYHPPYLHPRPRSYESRYYDPYFQHFDDRERDRRYGYDAFDDGRAMLPPPPPPLPPANKQRRIIYYATLPEVVRSPSPTHGAQGPHGEQRYSYRSGYETDRYMEPDYYRTSTATNVRNQNHHNQKQYDRPSAPVTDQAKTPLFPVKVSTDVNVREPKKNPERRIYSDVDRRFTYKPPSFQTADEGNF